MRSFVLIALLAFLAPLAAATESAYHIQMGCEGQGKFGTSAFSACTTAECDGGSFKSSGVCSRTNTGFTKLEFTSYAASSLHSPTLFAMHTGDVLITPAIQAADTKPSFTVQTDCPASGSTLNWAFVQWDAGTRAASETYWIGDATYATPGGIVITGQYDIDGTVYWAGPVPMHGSCTNGVYALALSNSSDISGSVYFTAAGGGVYKTDVGHATFFFPRLVVQLAAHLGGKTGRGIAFDSRAAANTSVARVVSNASGNQFTITPYTNAETGSVAGAPYTDVITVTRTNFPKDGMLLGTISRDGGPAAKLGCIVNRNFDMRVICTGQSPSDPTYPYTVTFVFEGDGAGGNGCPTDYVRVPQDSQLGVFRDFCLAKYEMKIVGNDDGVQTYNASFVAESRAVGTPWARVSRNDAISECQALGVGYDLVTNAEWQAVARNIEDAYSNGTYLNWSTGHQDNSLGDSHLNFGLSKNAPSAAQAASASDSDAYFCTNDDGCTVNATGSFDQKRTHQLSNGEIIWDLAGNLWEWTKDDLPAIPGFNSFVATHPWTGADLLRYGPRGSYHAGGTYPKTVAPYGGLGYAFLNFALGGTLRRGGRFDSMISGGGWQSGVFASAPNYNPTSSYVDTAFRCAWHATNELPMGYFDVILGDTLYGWAVDGDETATALTIEIYADGTAEGGGVLVGTTTANLARPDVNAATGFPGDHGYGYTLPVPYQSASHSYYVYAVDAGGGLRALLTNSPKSKIIPANVVPQGSFDLVQNFRLQGWSFDMNTSSDSSYVAVFVDGVAGVGTFIGTILADIPRSDVNSIFSIGGDHGFSFPIPDAYQNPARTFHVYSVDTEGGPGTYLGARAFPLPTGSFDVISGGLAQGWTLSRNDIPASIEYRLYADNPAELGGLLIAQGTTNTPRPDVNALLGVTGVHGFAVPVGAYSGRTLYAYGVDSKGFMNFVGTKVVP